MKIPLFKPTASDTSTSRRQLLSRGVGLAASVALPLGISGLGLAVPSEALAAGTADGMRILWKDKDSKLINAPGKIIE